jgi:multidrug efflux pump subunit AcrA (membrane-fusion protein)
LLISRSLSAETFSRWSHYPKQTALARSRLFECRLAGEVVQPGQMIFQVARKGRWDAVFDVPAPVIRSAPPDAKIIVTLTDDPSVTATGRVRQVDPQADPVTRTFGVRVSLIDPPAVMRLGATVTGRMEMGSAMGISIPASALTNKDRQAAVWIVDPASLTVPCVTWKWCASTRERL